MRVIVYVPLVHGAARTRRSIEREVRRQGHEIVGQTSSRTEAQAALSAGIADMVAGRPDHLLDLAPWALGVTSRTAAAKSAGMALPVWASYQVHRHPVRAASVGAALAGLTAAAALALPSSDRDDRFGPAALPPRSSSPAAPSAAPPARSALPVAPGGPAPTELPSRRTLPPPRPPATAGRRATPAPAAPGRRESAPPPAPPRRTTAPPPATPSAPPPTYAPPPGSTCLITLDTSLLNLRLCVGRLSS